MKRRTYYDIVAGTVALLFLLGVPNIESATGSESDVRPESQDVVQAAKLAPVWRNSGQGFPAGHSGERHADLFYMLPRSSDDSYKEEDRKIISPGQCPYRTWSRNLMLPLLGKVDLRLFCIPPQ